MTKRPAHKSVIAAAALLPEQIRATRICGWSTFLIVSVAAGIATPAYAANSSSGASSSNTGYYGQFYQPGSVPAASVTVPETQTPLPSRQPSLPSRYIAPDASGLAYQPGFHGCAPSVRAGSSSGLGGPLTPMPEVPAQARNRYFRYGISVAETYTDNVELASEGNEEGAWVTQVVPSLQACADGGRIKGSLDYQLQAMYYANESDPLEIYHDVSGATTIEVLPGHLFLAADSSYGQTIIDASRAYSNSNVVRSNNRTSAWITNISPYWFQQLGPVGHATLRYRYGRAEYDSDRVSDYTLHGVYFNLGSPREYTTWSYQLSISSQRMENEAIPNTATAGVNGDETEVNHFDSAMLRVGYNVTDAFQLFAVGGAQNEYQRDGSVDRYGSALWSVGFRWASLRNSLEASVGHRAFGSTYSVAIRHEGEGFNAALTYDENQTAPGLQQLNPLNQFNNGTSSVPNVRPGQLGEEDLLGDRGVYVRKRLTGAISLEGTRTQTTFEAYYGSREYVTRDVSDKDVYGGSVSLSYELGVRTQLNSRLGLEYQETDQEKFRVGEAGVGATYQLTSSSQAGLSYSHRWRDGESGNDSYDENRFMVRYSRFF